MSSGHRAAAHNNHNQHHNNHGYAHHEKHGLGRLLPYAPPWLIWLGSLAIALLGHWLWGQWGNWVGKTYPLFVYASTHFLIWVCWRMTKPLHEVLRVLACASVAFMGLFVIVVGIFGMGPVLWSLWGGIGFVLCAGWMARRMLIPAHERGVAANNNMAQRLVNALNGAQLGGVKQIEGEASGTIRVPLEVKRGEQTVAELKHIPETVETLTGLRPGAARLVHSTEDAGMSELRINPVDRLKGIVPWRGPSNFGASVHEPFPMGLYASMGQCQIFLTGEEAEGRNLAQWLIMGMTGAAKSQSMRMLVADILTRKDVTVWAHDHVKGLQTLKPLIEGGGLDWVTMTKPDGQAMLATVRVVVQARARWMGAKGFDQWTPGCGLNLLVVWVEEASDLAQLKILLQLAREARSVGVVLFISLQRASHTTIDTDTRAQLSGNMCFGVESEQDAKFGLPSHVIEAGASPERWRAEKPGYCYISAPGIPEDMQAEELRTFFAGKDQILDAVTRGKAVRRALADEADMVTVKAAGNVYARRLLPEAYLPGHPQFAKAIGMDVNTVKDDEMEDDINLELEANKTPEPYGAPEANNVADDDTDEDNDDDVVDEEGNPIDMGAVVDELNKNVEIPDCPLPNMVTSTGPKQQLTTEQCRERVQQYLKALNADGKPLVTVPDVLNMKPPIRRGREWIRTELRRLAGEIEGEVPSPQGFRLERDKDCAAGEFRILEPTLVGSPA